MSEVQVVAGKCPACMSTGSLSLGLGGHVTCMRTECPRPMDVDDLLQDRIAMGFALQFLREVECRGVA